MSVVDKRIPDDPDVSYVEGSCISDKLDIFTYEGVGPKGLFYIGGRLSDGKILSKILWKPKGRLDFGNWGGFNFSNASICEVRGIHKIVKLEMQTGDDYSHLEDLGMPWQQIYSVLNKVRNREQLEKEKLVNMKRAA